MKTVHTFDFILAGQTGAGVNLKITKKLSLLICFFFETQLHFQNISAAQSFQSLSKEGKFLEKLLAGV